jgi:membrane fusion protein (multidrug efflux system)
VVGPDNKVEVRPVKLGARIGTMWIVDEGLAAGERVIVEGFSRAKSGEPVAPKEAPPAETAAR